MKCYCLILIAILPCGLAVPQLAGAQGLDVKVSYGEQGQAQSLEWFPSPSQPPVEAYEIQGYSDSGAVLYVETVPASRLSAAANPASRARAVEPARPKQTTRIPNARPTAATRLPIRP